jgi:hypothetical protein|tara:strand:- start:1247 stop:1672 length:426 start_codon:yes stop_codon:yes gene_type:complete
MTSSQSRSDQPYDEFYASIKLVSGEEILAMVVVDNTDKEIPDQIVIDNPVIFKEIRANGTNIPMGYKFEPWMKLTDDSTYVLPMSKIITISQISSSDIVNVYKDVIQEGFEPDDHPDLTKEMGYVSTVDKARDLLEKLYES